MVDFLQVLFGLVVMHALADYPLQGDFLAKAKNRLTPIPGIPWWQALGAHAVIHGGGVALITGSVTLGLVEVVVHFLIDDFKCRGRIGFNGDQSLHIACKIIYAGVVAMALLP